MAASGFIANQLHADGSMQKMIESMQKEIDKRFLKGIAAFLRACCAFLDADSSGYCGFSREQKKEEGGRSDEQTG